MKPCIRIGALVCISMMPFSSYADDAGGVGTNMGLDFYSRIDDLGDSLAQGIVSRRLTEKGNYGSLGCGATWMNSSKIDQKLLDELVVGNYTLLLRIAWAKKVSLTTTTLASLSQCLVEKYSIIQKSARNDQNTLEMVGNIWLYMDGDTANSDYDIVSDITRINTIIFKEKYDYVGTKNASAGAIASMLAGQAIAPLFPKIGGMSGAALGSISNGWTSRSGSTTPSDPPVGVPLPWAGICQVGDIGSSSSGTDTLFGDGFFDDLGSSLAGERSGNGLITTHEIWANNTGTGLSTSNFWASGGPDFFHSVPCTGIFCITIDMKWGSQNALGGFANTSIESLLEKHSNMMDPISWSDLSQQEMPKNSYQLPFLSVKFKDKIAGGRIFMTEAPQQSKRLAIDDTKEKKDAIFDAAFRCAMNEAGVQWDAILSNGFIGAGYVPRRNASITNIIKTTIPVWPQEMDNLAGCYNIRINQWKKQAYQWLSTDLNEIQGFTDAMMNIILQILDTDKKLDTLPSK